MTSSLSTSSSSSLGSSRLQTLRTTGILGQTQSNKQYTHECYECSNWQKVSIINFNVSFTLVCLFSVPATSRRMALGLSVIIIEAVRHFVFVSAGQQTRRADAGQSRSETHKVNVLLCWLAMELHTPKTNIWAIFSGAAAFSAHFSGNVVKFVCLFERFWCLCSMHIW